MNKKSIFSIIFSFLLIFSFLSLDTYASENLAVEMDGKKVQVNVVPIVLDGKPIYATIPSLSQEGSSLVSVRFIGEYYGAEVDWDNHSQSARVRQGGREVVMKINSRDVYIDGELKRIESGYTPKLVKFPGYKTSSTMVPLRFFSEIFDYEVGWNPELKVPFVNTQNGENPNGLVETISLEETNTGQPVLIVKAKDRINYSVNNSKNKSTISITNGSLVKKQANINANKGSLESVEIKNKRAENSLNLVLNLKENSHVDILRVNSSKELHIYFTKKVNKISEEKKDKSREIIVEKDGKSSIRTMKLTNPNRLVVDFLDSSLDIGNQSLPKNIRVSQFSPQGLYGNYSRVVRLVYDLNENESFSDIDIEDLDKEFRIKIKERQVISKPEEKPEDKPENKPEEKPIIKPARPGETLIVLDPGHGGYDPGAVSNGVNEKDVNLAVSLKVRDLLVAKGYRVEMTRDTDEYMHRFDRGKFANELNADIFLSIHANSAKNAPSANGAETLYKTKEDRELARAIQEEVIKYTGASDRKIKYRADLAVLNQTNMPASLIELGFLTNDNERNMLVNNGYQNILAKGIASGIEKYFNN